MNKEQAQPEQDVESAGPDAGQQAPAPVQRVEDLPEWAQAHIRQLRQENAKTRTDLRQAQQEAQAATAERDDLRSQLDSAQQETQKLTEERDQLSFGAARDRLMRERGISTENGLSKEQVDAIAAAIVGSDEESIKKSLDALAAVLPTAPAGGTANPSLGGGERADNDEAAAVAAAFFGS